MKKTIATIAISAMIVCLSGYRATGQFSTKNDPTIGNPIVPVPMVWLKAPADAVKMVSGNTVLADVSAHFVPEDLATALYFALADARILTASDFTATWQWAMVVPTAPMDGFNVFVDCVGVDVFGKYRLQIVCTPVE